MNQLGVEFDDDEYEMFIQKQPESSMPIGSDGSLKAPYNDPHRERMADEHFRGHHRPHQQIMATTSKAEWSNIELSATSGIWTIVAMLGVLVLIFLARR